MKKYLVKVKTPVFCERRYEIDEEIEIEEKDMKDDLFEIIEEIEENKEIQLEDMKVDELKKLAKDRDIEGFSKMKREELLNALLDDQKEEAEVEE